MKKGGEEMKRGGGKRERVVGESEGRRVGKRSGGAQHPCALLLSPPAAAAQ